MDNKDQVIVHVNSHGPASQANYLTANNRFANMTNKPINDVNKIGLLYSSFPRVYEPITIKNNTFHMRISGSQQSWEIECTIPLVNFYPGKRA